MFKCLFFWIHTFCRVGNECIVQTQYSNCLVHVFAEAYSSAWVQSIHLYPCNVYFHVRRHSEHKATLYFTVLLKQPTRHNILRRLFSLTMERQRYLCRTTHPYPQRKINQQRQQTLEHLLIQKGSIPVPKITAWNEMDRAGQIMWL